MKLKYHQFSNQLLRQCVDKMKSYEKLDELRFSGELAIEIAKFINSKILEAENINESKIDRSEILVCAFKEVFKYSDAELHQFESNIIEFLIDRKLIKKIKLSKKMWKTMRAPLKFFLSTLSNML